MTQTKRIILNTLATYGRSFVTLFGFHGGHKETCVSEVDRMLNLNAEIRITPLYTYIFDQHLMPIEHSEHSNIRTFFYGKIHGKGMNAVRQSEEDK